MISIVPSVTSSRRCSWFILSSRFPRGAHMVLKGLLGDWAMERDFAYSPVRGCLSPASLTPKPHSEDLCLPSARLSRGRRLATRSTQHWRFFGLNCSRQDSLALRDAIARPVVSRTLVLALSSRFL